jgi:carboxyl-terminal processing protease
LEKNILANNIGYIKLSTFEQIKTVNEFKDALSELYDAGVTSLILDLRNNGGGLLQNAVGIASMFIEEGPIVYAVDRNNNKTSSDASGTVIWDKPVVVLVNGGSASASEILAAALRDYDIADIVGVNTFGKNLIQNIRQLEDGSALLFTIAKYQTPSQEDIPKTGITPDYIVAIPTAEADSIELGSENDPQLLKALEILGANNYEKI